MKFLLLLSALFLLCSPVANAGTTAFELDGNDLRIPVSNAGAIAFRQCTTCSFQRERLSASAHFELNKTTTNLEQLRQALATTPDKGKAMITLFYDDDNQRVTRIAVRIR